MTGTRGIALMTWCQAEDSNPNGNQFTLAAVPVKAHKLPNLWFIS